MGFFRSSGCLTCFGRAPTQPHPQEIAGSSRAEQKLAHAVPAPIVVGKVSLHSEEQVEEQDRQCPSAAGASGPSFTAVAHELLLPAPGISGQSLPPAENAVTASLLGGAPTQKDHGSSLERVSPTSSAFFSVAGWSNYEEELSSLHTVSSRTAGGSHAGLPLSLSLPIGADVNAAHDQHLSAPSATAARAPPHDNVRYASGHHIGHAPGHVLHVHAVQESGMLPTSLADGNDSVAQPTGTHADAASVPAPATEAAGPQAAGPSVQPSMQRAMEAPGSSMDTASMLRQEVLALVTDMCLRQGRTCQAYQVLLAWCQAQGVALEQLDADLRQMQLPDGQGLKQVSEQVSNCLDDIADDAGWSVVRNDELKLLHKHQLGTNVHAFRARCILDSPVENLLALTREVDLAPSWNKYCKGAYELQLDSPTGMAAYMVLWMPWPFHAMAFAVEAKGMELLDEHGCFIIAISTLWPLPPSVKPPPGYEKHRRVRVLHPTTVKYTPLLPAQPGDPERTYCELQAYVDAGVNVPNMIITFVLKIMSPFVYNTVKRLLATTFKAKDLPLPRRVVERPELYGMARKRTDVYLEKQRHKQQQQTQAPQQEA